MDKYETEEVPEELPSKLPSGLEGIGKGLGIGGQPLNVSKSLLGPQGAMASSSMGPVVSHAPISASALGAMSQIQSIPPQVHSAMNPMVPQTNPSMGMNMPVDQRTAGNLNPVMAGGNGMMSYSSQSGVRMNPPVMAGGSVAPSGVYEREFRESGMMGRTPSTDTVLVRNLPPSLTWQSLKDRFSEVGEVYYAELKGVGVALVRFRTERDAQRAVEVMNTSRFEGRIIDVSLYF